MIGQLFLLLISMLLQGQESVLPPGMGAGPNLTNGRTGSQSNLASEQPIPDSIGWGTDNTNVFCMIIQIAPEDIASFARGSQGQELTANVPEGIRTRIQRIIVRIGKGPVERNPSLQALANNRTPASSPYLATLGGSSAVTLESPFSQNVNASAQNGNLLGNNGFNGATNNEPVLPSAAPVKPILPGNPNNQDRPFPVASNGGTGGNNAFPGTGGNPGSNSFSNAGNAPNSLRNSEFEKFGAPAVTPNVRDDFTPKSKYWDPIKTNPGSGMSNNASNVNNYNYSNPNNTPPNNHSIYNNPGYAGAPRPYTPVANNNSPGAFGTPVFDNLHSQQNSYLGQQNQQFQPQQNSPPISQSLQNQYGQPATPPPGYVTNNFPYGNQQSILPTTVAGLAGPGSNRTSTGTGEVLPADDSVLAKDKLLPFLLLFSIVGNVYLGLWMSHLRKRYRELLSNMRGIPVSDL